MKLRTRGTKFGFNHDEAFDGLTAEEIRRIRGGARANITPGLESLAPILVGELKRVPTEPTKRKRGRRA